MPEGRKRTKRKVERPPAEKSWWSRNWRYVDSGVTAGCLPLIAVLVATPIALLL